MREIVHLQAGQCGNQIGAKVRQVSFKEVNVFACQISHYKINSFEIRCRFVLPSSSGKSFPTSMELIQLEHTTETPTSS